MKKVAIFAHYNKTPVVVPWCLVFLKSLCKSQFEVHFVSNSPLDDSSLLLLEPYTKSVVIRENVGLDFAMWRHHVSTMDFSDVSELLLTNSSIIGPLSDLTSIWEAAASWDCDFWGLTNNNEIHPHIQSYFILFRHNVITSKAFNLFWQSILDYSDKTQIVRSYEVGLTVWLEQHGFRWKVFAEEESVLCDCYAVSLPLTATLHRMGLHFIPKVVTIPFNPNPIFKKILSELRFRPYTRNNTSGRYPDALLKKGFPFLKASAITIPDLRFPASAARRLLRFYNKGEIPVGDYDAEPQTSFR